MDTFQALIRLHSLIQVDIESKPFSLRKSPHSILKCIINGLVRGKIEKSLQRVVVIMGSKSDLEFAKRIKETLSMYSILCDLRIASAHRTPEHLLRILAEYASLGDQIVAITVAGLSDALSGVVAAQRLFPVVACPPDTDKLGYPKVFSSEFTPSDVPVAFVNEPSKAAHFVAQIFALTDRKIAREIANSLEDKKRQIVSMDENLTKSPDS